MTEPRIIAGDCVAAMASMAPASVDSIVTDPPYHFASIVKRYGKTSIDGAGTNEQRARDGSDQFIRASRGFMGKEWDGGDIAFRPETWAAALRVLKPGGHLVAFGAPKNYHRLACAIEDAGFEIRDSLMWIFGSGFPKSLDVSKAIDKAAGAERAIVGRKSDPRYKSPATAASGAPMGNVSPRANGAETYAKAGFVTAPATPEAAEWEGWGTALKPAYEPIILARKPLIGTVAENVLAHGTGALNIDACRVEGGERPLITSDRRLDHNTYGPGLGGSKAVGSTALGRWPANLVHDGSEEVLAAFPESKGQQGDLTGHSRGRTSKGIYGDMPAARDALARNDSGSAARFFYCAKAGKNDRAGSKHPTVKPIALMRWLVRLITPPGGTVLDPFAGSGTTGQAAMEEGFGAILIEREAEYLADIERRIANVPPPTPQQESMFGDAA